MRCLDWINQPIHSLMVQKSDAKGFPWYGNKVIEYNQSIIIILLTRQWQLAGGRGVNYMSGINWDFFILGLTYVMVDSWKESDFDSREI